MGRSEQVEAEARVKDRCKKDSMDTPRKRRLSLGRGAKESDEARSRPIPLRLFPPHLIPGHLHATNSVLFMGFCLAVPTIWALLALAARYADALPGFPFGFGLGPGISSSQRKCTPATFEDVLPSEAVITNITYVFKGGSYGEGAPNIAYPTNPTGLPALCAVTVNVTSSASSSYRFGLFLPSAPRWKSRFLAVGNGGFAGGINWLDMAPGAHYGMATVSTDTGHNGSTTDLTWATNEPEKKSDWGWRAMHGSVQLGKKMAEAFYGKAAKYSYYNGCSTGGRQGLKEIQLSPDSFDGALIGAPSWYVSHINTYVNEFGMYNLPVNASYYIPTAEFTKLGKAVVEQCDGVDGVVDGIVSSPELCTFDFSRVQCGNPGVNASGCLSEAQIGTAKKAYADHYAADTGEFIYTGLTLSSENQWYILLGGTAPSPFGVQYVQNFLLDDRSWRWQTYNDSLTYLAERLDPGQATAARYDAGAAFRDRGGKMILYHGLADGLVATRGSTLFYNRTVEATGGGPVDDWLRYFQIPGMGHCTGTSVGAPWNIAGAYQPGSMDPGLWSVPGYRDAHHDAVLALIDWVEKGKPVDSIIATTWKNATDPSTGVLRQRPLCPYPQKAVYNGRGNVDHASSWKCS